MPESASLGIACAIATFLLWGVADYLAARISRQVGEMRTLLGLQLIGAPILVFSWGIAQPPAASPADLMWITLGAASFFVGYLAFFHGLRVGAISLVSPISSAGGLIPVAVGVLVLGETLSGWRAGGITLTLIGLAVALTDLKAVRDLDVVGRRRGAWAGFITLVMWGSGTAFILPAIARMGWFAPIALLRGEIALLVAAWFAFRWVTPARTPLTSAMPWRLVIPAALLDLGAFFAYGVALQSAPVSLAAPIASAYPLVTILLARHWLNERLTPREAVGVATTIIGVAVLGFG